MTWVRSGRVDVIQGAWAGSHLVFLYPGPPWIERWWQRPGMLSTMDLLVVGGSQLDGRDLVFGQQLTGQRVWIKREPTTPEPAAHQPRTPSVAAVEERPPMVDSPVTLRPVIAVEDEQVTTGRAFVLQPTGTGDPLIITAAGLFGPPGGLAHTVNPQMLPALVGDALFFDLLDGAMRARGAMLRPPSGTRAVLHGTAGPPDASHDVLALELLPGHSLSALLLRTDPVASGQQLWLPGAPAGVGAAEESLRACQVVTAWEQGYSVRFASGFDLGGQVGAPLLDSQGRVAGMLVGHGDGERSDSLGIVIPARWIATRLGW